MSAMPQSLRRWTEHAETRAETGRFCQCRVGPDRGCACAPTGPVVCISMAAHSRNASASAHPRLAITIGVLALIGLVLSLLVHVSTLAGIEVEHHVPQLWVLYGGCTLGYLGMYRNSISAMVRWRRLLVYGVGIYAVANLLLVYLQADGAVSQRGGRYLLLSDSEIVRELTLAEFQIRRMRELQACSGFWLFFYLYPAMFHLGQRQTPADQS